MPKLVPRRFSNLKHIQTVDKEYFRQLLSPFPQDCRRHGLELDHLTDEALFKFFTSFDASTSGELLEVMHMLNEVACEHGADRLCERARRRGHDLTGGRADMDPREIAIRAYLWDKSVVLKIHDRLSYRQVDSFREFIGASPFILDVSDAEAIAQMEARLTRYFARKDRGDFCEIRAYAEGCGVNFIVIHGKRYTRKRVRDEQNQPKTLPFRPEKHDLVIYDNRTSRLKICAQYLPENDEYRRVFGEVLFTGPDHFDQTDVYDLSPLQARGPAALDHQGIPGIAWVRAAEVKILLGANGHGSFELHLRAKEGDGDIFEILDVHPVTDIRHGKLTYAKLKVKFERMRGRPRALEILPENHAKFNRWTHTDSVTRFLERNGLVKPPLGTAAGMPVMPASSPVQVPGETLL